LIHDGHQIFGMHVNRSFGQKEGYVAMDGSYFFMTKKRNYTPRQSQLPKASITKVDRVEQRPHSGLTN